MSDKFAWAEGDFSDEMTAEKLLLFLGTDPVRVRRHGEAAGGRREKPELLTDRVVDKLRALGLNVRV